MALRADFRHILYSDVQANNNYEGTLGLAFVFGGQKPAAAAPKTGEGWQAWPPPSAEAAAPPTPPKIAWVADFLKKNPGAKAVIEGHTDDVGNPGANNKLSLARAESVKKYLMENFGIEGSRLSTAGYGSSRPIADNATQDGKRQNRRIEAIFR